MLFLHFSHHTHRDEITFIDFVVNPYQGEDYHHDEDYDQPPFHHKILAFQIGKRNDKIIQKLFKKLRHLTINHYHTDGLTKKHIPPERLLYGLKTLHSKSIRFETLPKIFLNPFFLNKSYV